MNPAIDEIEAFARLQARLPAIWAEVHEQPRQPHSCLIVPSLSFDQEELQKVKGVPFYEERLMFMLMRLRRPGVRIMYITSQPVEEDVVDYYLQLLVGIPPLHAKRRLTMLCVQDASPRALTEKILERPRVVERIRQWIGDRDRAYMSCFTTSPLERTLAVQLGIPLNGADPALAHLGSKSGSRETFREAGIELPDGFENLADEAAAVAALDRLQRDEPRLRRAVVKINDGFSGEGNALFTYPNPMPDGEPARRAAIGEALDRMKFSAPEHSRSEFFAKFAQMGGIVEQYGNSSELL